MKKFKWQYLIIIFALFLFLPCPTKAEEQIVTCKMEDLIISNKLRTDADNCSKVIVQDEKYLGYIKQMPWLKEIEFANLSLDDISFINDLDNLTKLIISGSNISLKNLDSKITDFNVYNSYVRNLEALGNCRYLQNIILSDTSYFRDLEFLRKIPWLKTLSIDFPAYTNIDLSPILSLNRLETLNLWGLEQNIKGELLNFLKRGNVETSFTLNKDYESYYASVQNIYNSLNLDGLSNEEQIQKIVLYVIDNITYDQALTGEAGQRAFKNEIMIEKALAKTGVCRQYTLLTNLLLEMAGFNAIQVRSNADENHIWNAVYLDGSWYAIDPTWLDTDEGRAKVVSNIHDTYYLVNPYGNFITDHHPLSNLLAMMTPVFKITFDTKGGNSIAPVYVSPTNYTLPAPTKQNSEFDDWYSDTALINNYEVTPLNKDLTLYAGYNDTLRIESAAGMPNPPTSVISYLTIGGLAVLSAGGYIYLRKHNKFKRI